MTEATFVAQDLGHQAAKLMHHILGTGPIRVDYIPVGVMTWKFVVTDAGGSEYILRIYPAGRSDIVDVEPDVLRRCRRAGLCVAEVIADSRSGPHAEFSYIVYRRIPGKRLTLVLESLALRAKNHLAGEITQQLAMLDGLEMTGYGELHDCFHGKALAWNEFIDEAFRHGSEALHRNSLLPGSLLKRIAVLENRTGDFMPDMAPRLVWADINTDNILVDDEGGLTGLIDFESCLSGDGLLTLGYCAALYGRSGLAELLVSAYPKPIGPSELVLIDWYTVVRLLRIAPYHASGRLPTGHAFAPLLSTFAGFESALRRLT